MLHFQTHNSHIMCVIPHKRENSDTQLLAFLLAMLSKTQIVTNNMTNDITYNSHEYKDMRLPENK